MNEVLRGGLEAAGGLALLDSGGALQRVDAEGEEEVDQACDPGAVEWAWDDPFPKFVADDGSEPVGPTLEAGGCSVDEDWSGAAKDSLALAAAGNGTFTFRLPYGEYPDGSFGTIVDTPGFSVGEEVVVFLTYEPDGDPLFMPLSWMGWSVYRVYRGAGGKTAVVDGFGHELVRRSNAIPGVGRGDPALRFLYYQDPPIDPQAAGAALNTIASNATWTGSGRAVGPWRGRLRATVGGDVASSCLADLAGLVNASSLSLQGRCNADLAGSTDVLVQGTFQSGGWSGTITFSPRGLPEESRAVPWASVSDTSDRWVGHAAGNHAEAGHAFTYDIDLWGSFVGPRPLLSFTAFRNYLVGVAAAHEVSAGIGASIDLDAATCAFTQPIVGAP
ncbi:MAG: hypothetical protein ABMA64_12260 [Myxococcota bacterium]